jgi:predicted MFS family arabinose efflux permease
MTTTAAPAPAATTRPRLVSRPLLLVFAADFAGLSGFYLLLSVVPMYASAAGMGVAGAGMTTAAMMAATVAAEFAMPRLVAAFGHRTVLIAGLVLLGVPAMALPLFAGTVAVLAVCLLRGVGLAVIFVVCGELGAALVPAERRGEGLGVLGVVAGVPALLAMPTGVWLADRIGYGPVFVAGGVVALVGLVAAAGLPRQPLPDTASSDTAAVGMSAVFRMPAMRRPTLVFTATAVGAGALLTFLPVTAPSGSAGLASMALLGHSVAATASRWWAGRHGDRRGPSGLLSLGALLAAAGMLALAVVGSPVMVLVGAVVMGAGFGVVQNASLAAMYSRVGIGAFGAVTALWSVAYDTGLGLGAAGFGLLSDHTGYATAYAVTAVLIAAALMVRRAHGGHQ